jgi:putative salt-induced outer membrane protein YdiY
MGGWVSLRSAHYDDSLESEEALTPNVDAMVKYFFLIIFFLSNMSLRSAHYDDSLESEEALAPNVDAMVKYFFLMIFFFIKYESEVRTL